MSTPADADDARQQRKREAARLRMQERRSDPANAEAVAAETEAARVRMQERRSDPANAEARRETEAERLRQQERRVRLQERLARAEAERLRQQERRSDPAMRRPSGSGSKSDGAILAARASVHRGSNVMHDARDHKCAGAQEGSCTMSCPAAGGRVGHL